MGCHQTIAFIKTSGTRFGLVEGHVPKSVNFFRMFLRKRTYPFKLFAGLPDGGVVHDVAIKVGSGFLGEFCRPRRVTPVAGADFNLGRFSMISTTEFSRAKYYRRPRVHYDCIRLKFGFRFVSVIIQRAFHPHSVAADAQYEFITSRLNGLTSSFNIIFYFSKKTNCFYALDKYYICTLFSVNF